MTSASEAPSIPDLDESIDASSLSVNTVASSVSAFSSQNNSKKRSKSTRASKIEVEATESQPPLIHENNGHANTTAPRGTKRSSDLISVDERGERESTVKPEPPTKRRNTRTQNSVSEQVDYPVLRAEPETMTTEPAPPKPTKGGKKRASSRTRKTSAASTASLRAAIPDNATIDAVLEADLDRPMSDDDQLVVEEKEELPKKRGRKPKTTAASTASARRPQATTDEQAALELVAKTQTVEDAETHLTYNTDVEGPAPSRLKSTKGKAPKKAAAKLTTRTNRGSAESVATMATDLEPQIDSSMITTRTEADDSGHETDASIGGKSVVRKGSKRKATAKGRGKKGGTGMMSKNIEDIVQSQQQNETIHGAAAKQAAEVMDVCQSAVLPTAHAPVPAHDEQVPSKPARTATKPEKVKSTKTKKPKAEDKPSQLSMPGAFSPLIPGQEQDIEPSFASVLSPTSPSVVAKPITNADVVASLHMTSPSMSVTPPRLPPRSPLRNTAASARPTPTPQRTNVPRGQKETTPSPSPQSSDAENAPPSTRPPSTRPPLAPLSPSKNQITRVPLAPGTPRAVPLSPSKIGGGLRSDIPWTSVDVEMAFAIQTPEGGKENLDIFGGMGVENGSLTSPEKKMTVEEWINWNARKAEERLKAESERVVGIFEREGGRALMVLESIEVLD
jgi:hypothetical protein